MLQDQTTKHQQTTTASMTSWGRRYDVDWLSTLALGLLIIHHVVISFQPWTQSIGFPQNDQSQDGLWVIMSMNTIWRIPVMFLISGMGVRFAMQRCGWKRLLKDRTVRILVLDTGTWLSFRPTMLTPFIAFQQT
jgi:hypothetical protein